MKKATAQKKSHSTRSTTKRNKPKQPAKVLKLKIPKKRRVSIKRALLAGLFIALVIWAAYPLKQRAEQKRETRLLQGRIDRLKAENNKLEEEVNRLNSDDYIEQMARRDFGLVKPGESSVLVVPEKEGETEGVKQSPDSGEKQAEEDNSEEVKEKDTEKEEDTKKEESKSDKKENKSKSSKSNSNKPWWQNFLSYLDNLTGTKK